MKFSIVVSLLGMFFVGTQAVNLCAANPGRTTKETALAENLLVVAKKKLTDRQIALSDSTFKQLESFVAEGARKMAEEGNPDVETAKNNLERFVEALSKGRKNARGEVELSEAEFQNVKNLFCPLYPFC